MITLDQLTEYLRDTGAAYIMIDASGAWQWNYLDDEGFTMPGLHGDDIDSLINHIQPQDEHDMITAEREQLEIRFHKAVAKREALTGEKISNILAGIGRDLIDFDVKMGSDEMYKMSIAMLERQNAERHQTDTFMQVMNYTPMKPKLMVESTPGNLMDTVDRIANPFTASWEQYRKALIRKAADNAAMTGLDPLWPSDMQADCYLESELTQEQGLTDEEAAALFAPLTEDPADLTVDITDKADRLIERDQSILALFDCKAFPAKYRSVGRTFQALAEGLVMDMPVNDNQARALTSLMDAMNHAHQAAQES